MKIGLLGYGYWGEYVARAIARAGELAVIVDPNPVRLVAAREQWGVWGTRVASEASVAYDLCDAVWVATPTSDHAGTVGAALAHGMHVLCEKPFVEGGRVARELATAAEEADRALMVGHLTLHMGRHDAFLAVEPAPRVVDAVRRNVQASLSDGSVLFGVGPHEVAPLIDRFGVPEAVECEGTLHRVVCTLQFAAASARVELDWLAEARTRSFRVDGTELAGQPDDQEPLLCEIAAFQAACAGEERERWLAHAVDISETLERLEHARLGSQVAA